MSTVASKVAAETGTAPIRLPIAALKPDPKNPRKIDDGARSGLAVSLETFGPLDIVFNDETGELVSGHQRIAALKAAGATDVVRDGDTGYVEHPKTGERFPVRFVRWDATKQRMANLSANNPEIAGEFDDRALAQLKALEDEVGFEDLRLKELLAEEGKDMVRKSTPAGLEQFDVTPAPKPAWILVATTSDRVAEIEIVLRSFVDDGDTRVEVSNV